MVVCNGLHQLVHTVEAEPQQELESLLIFHEVSLTSQIHYTVNMQTKELDSCAPLVVG